MRGESKRSDFSYNFLSIACQSRLLSVQFLPSIFNPALNKATGVELLGSLYTTMSGTSGEGLNDRQLQLIAFTSTCLVLSTLAVVLRLLVRWFSPANLWWDDWITVLALV